MLVLERYCALRIATAFAFCALAFSTPYAVGGAGLIEDRVWATVGASQSAHTLRVFVDRFPESRFAAMAEERITALELPAPNQPTWAGSRYVQ